MSEPKTCIFCGVSEMQARLYVTRFQLREECFCLPCYEKHLDDKRLEVRKE